MKNKFYFKLVIKKEMLYVEFLEALVMAFNRKIFTDIMTFKKI